MPQWLLTCFIQMLPRLHAEEQLRGIDALSLASPYAKQYERARGISRLRQLASGDCESHGYHVHEMTPRQQQSAFAMMGLKVVNVTPN